MKSPLALSLVLLAVPSLASAATNCLRQVMCMSTYAPVCGSDGQTYSNQCVFDKATCQNAKLTKLFDGACGVTANPFCGLKCAATPEQPVCGTDGATYATPCLLSAARCGNSTLTVAHDGPCTLKPTLTPKPTPKACNDVCPMIYSPVCGSDGKTYSNACLLGVAACKDKKKRLMTAHTGACDEPPATKCVHGCPKIALPVCGSDNKTYGNQCLLENAVCAKPALTKAYDGKCKPPPVSACAKVQCVQHSECKVDASTGRAFCADVCDPRRCAADETCSLQTVQCVMAPCPPVAVCTKKA